MGTEGMRAFDELPMTARAALRERVVRARAGERTSRDLFREFALRGEGIMRVAPEIFEDLWPQLASMRDERRLRLAARLFGFGQAEEALSVCDRIAARRPASGVAA